MGPLESHAHLIYPPAIRQALLARDPVNVIAAFSRILYEKPAAFISSENTNTAQSKEPTEMGFHRPSTSLGILGGAPPDHVPKPSQGGILGGVGVPS